MFSIILQVLVYGPGQLPLLLPGVGQAGLSPTTLIRLQDYALVLGSSVPILDMSETNSGSFLHLFKQKVMMSYS